MLRHRPPPPRDPLVLGSIEAGARVLVRKHSVVLRANRVAVNFESSVLLPSVLCRVFQLCVGYGDCVSRVPAMCQYGRYVLRVPAVCGYGRCVSRVPTVCRVWTVCVACASYVSIWTLCVACASCVSGMDVDCHVCQLCVGYGRCVSRVPAVCRV